MAEAQREVTEGDGEAEEEEVEVQAQHREPIKMATAGVTGKGLLSPPRDAAPQPPPILGSKRSPPPPLSAAHTGPSPTPSQRPSPALYRGAAPPASALTSGVNLFVNDGSFMELFKKQMEAKAGESSSSKACTAGEEQKGAEKSAEPDKRRPISFVGKRRGGAKLALKTGIVTKKPKNEEDDVVSNKGGAWAQYMAEVKKYKAHQCSDDDKTRPLVK